MILKNSDFFTLNFGLALASEEIDKLLVALEKQDWRTSIPIKGLSEDSLRFFVHDGDKKEIPKSELSDYFNPKQSPQFVHSYQDIRDDEAKLDEFLKSNLHERLPFDRHSLVVGGFGSSKHKFIVHENLEGRKYNLDKQNLLDFVSSHPDGSMMLSDLDRQTGSQVNIKTAEDLDNFIGEDGNKIDWVLDVIGLAAGYYFGEHEDWKNKEKDIMGINRKNRVCFDFNLFSHELPIKQYNVEAVKDEMVASLEGIIEFAAKENLTNEAVQFEKALQVLSPNGNADVSKFLYSNERLPEANRRLFNAAIQADFFAGMGSWNDVQIKMSEEYRRVSNRVVLSILDATVAAVMD